MPGLSLLKHTRFPNLDTTLEIFPEQGAIFNLKILFMEFRLKWKAGMCSMDTRERHIYKGMIASVRNKIVKHVNDKSAEMKRYYSISKALTESINAKPLQNIKKYYSYRQLCDIIIY